MSQSGSYVLQTGGLPVVQTVTGNSGGAVGPSGNNINIVGSGGVIVTGNPGTHTLTITDSGSLKSTTYVATTPYTVLLTDDIILVDTATIAAASTIKLPNAPGAASDGQVWTIKDWSGAAATYNITVTTVGGVVDIDGATTFVLSNNYESISVAWSQSRGTYSIVAEVETTVSNAIVTIDGNSGSVTGSTVTIVGGTSGAIFTGSGSVLTESFNYLAMHSANSALDGYIKVGSNIVFWFPGGGAGSQNIGIGVASLSAGASFTGNEQLVALGYNSGSNLGSGSVFSTVIGGSALFTATAAVQSVVVGTGALSNATYSGNDTAIGFFALNAYTIGTVVGVEGRNTAIGSLSLETLSTGVYNSAIGFQSGSNYAGSESNNILINSSGVVSESNVLRIGSGTGSGTQQLAAAYISGIKGVNLSTANVVVNNGTTDQLGTATITAGTGISVTAGTNAITIASTSGVVLSVTQINHASSPYTVLLTDQMILADVTAGVISVLLPNAPTTGRTITIKDKVGLSATSNITVTTVGGAVTIDGATSFVMNTAYESVSVIFDGTSYFVY